MKKMMSILLCCFVFFTIPVSAETLKNDPKNEDGILIFTSAVTSVTSLENQVIQLVNKERANAGLRPLRANTNLSKVARLKSQDMASKNYFSHTSPTYGDPFTMMKKFNIRYTAAGENIAFGQTSAAQVMKSWMNSPGHRRNILNPSFTQIGVGLAKNSSGRYYWTQQFIAP